MSWRLAERGSWPLKRPLGDQVELGKAIRNLFHGPDGPWVRAGPFPGAVYFSVDRAPRSPVRKGVCENSGVPRLKQDASEIRSDVPLVTLASRGIFRVPYWIPSDASVIR
ncbi:hypothetical protein CDL15_Pgr010139 [Punica granatum]|uniref:Uncharacterized protein n=1 Tax=Punica granatum TaxID=22663 RepID=A0A218Y2N4_PUNGR|nr:hypothetical protein CDL15_Pgr010139 [Punica granatum]